MAVQTFAIVVRHVELDVFRFRDRPKILHPDMMHAAPFRAVVAEHGVIRVASEAGMIAWDAIVLKMGGRYETLIVNVQAASEIRHHVTGKAKTSGSGALQLFVQSGPDRQSRQNAQRDEGENLSAGDPRQLRVKCRQDGENYDDAGE